MTNHDRQGELRIKIWKIVDNYVQLHEQADDCTNDLLTLIAAHTTQAEEAARKQERALMLATLNTFMESVQQALQAKQGEQ